MPLLIPYNRWYRRRHRRSHRRLPSSKPCRSVGPRTILYIIWCVHHARASNSPYDYIFFACSYHSIHGTRGLYRERLTDLAVVYVHAHVHEELYVVCGWFVFSSTHSTHKSIKRDDIVVLDCWLTGWECGVVVYLQFWWWDRWPATQAHSWMWYNVFCLAHHIRCKRTVA